ncbi:MAG: phosphatase PAP2 family protein, partial [Bradymonadaceae bacterium]
LGPPTRANWTGPLPGDAVARAALGARDDGWRAGYGTVSDVLLWTAVSYPLVVDSALVSGAIQRDGRMAAQSAALGMQSLALAEFTSTLLKYVVARQRPPSDCPGPAFCTDKRYQSFPSGHTTMAFTGASFTCAVHEHADLYGATWADRAACLGALGVAAATGLCRIMSENHYLSDVLAGALIGVTAGYLVPKALHFDRSIGTDERVRTAPGALGVPRGPAAPMVRYRFRF